MAVPLHLEGHGKASDFDQFALLGGVANLFIDNNKVRFAINLESARRSRLKLRFRLLSLAKVVK